MTTSSTSVPTIFLLDNFDKTIVNKPLPDPSSSIGDSGEVEEEIKEGSAII